MPLFSQMKRCARPLPIGTFIEHDHPRARTRIPAHHVFGRPYIAAFEARHFIEVGKSTLETTGVRLGAGGDDDLVGAKGLDIFSLEKGIEQDLHLELLELTRVPFQKIDDLSTPRLQAGEVKLPAETAR